MPRQASQRQRKKKPEPFSGVFYQKIDRPVKQLSTLSSADFGRRRLVWLGTMVVMTVLVTKWAAALPARLQILEQDSADSPISLKKEQTAFKELWRTTAERLDDFKNLAAAIARLKTAEASPTPQLTESQLEKIKSKLK